MAYDPIERRKRYLREKMQKANESPTTPEPATTPATPEPGTSATAVNAGQLVSESAPAQPGTTATPVSAGSLVESAPGNAPELPLGNVGTPPPISEPPPAGKKRIGRPPGTKNKPKADFGDVESIAAIAAEPAKPPVDYAAMSGAVFDMATSTLGIALGPEWLAKSPEEKQMVCVPLQAYFQAKQVEDLPPGLMLTFVLVAYSVPRLKEPPTAGKLKLGWQWLKSKLRRKKKGAVAMLPNINPEREVNEQGN
jgi:hypothetical protein